MPCTGRHDPASAAEHTNFRLTTLDVERMQVIHAPSMILPRVRDPRFVTIRRGGTLTDADHQLLALWAARCARSTCLTCSSRLSQKTDDRVRRSSMLAPGCVARCR